MRLDVDPGSELWLALRLGRVTASLAGACLRRDPHQGPLAAFREIMGITHKKENRYMEYGLRHEDNARYAFFQYGVRHSLFNEIHPGGFWISDEHRWLSATPDGLIDKDGVFDLKCPQTHLPEEVPPHHEIQLRVQMHCTDRSFADYYAWRMDGWEYYERIDRDLKIERDLIAELKVFHDSHILTNTPPPRRRPKGEK